MAQQRAGSGRMAQNGLSSLMEQQSQLLDMLMVEMNKKGGAQKRDEHVLDIVRNMENRVDEAKWPARLNQRMNDLDGDVLDMDPSLARKRKRDGMTTPSSGYPGGMTSSGMYNQGNNPYRTGR